MRERPARYQPVPLGKDHKMVRISKREMHLAYLHREETGEPIQSWIRRLIREHWDARALDAHLEEEYELRTHLDDNEGD